jgi:nucleotide-binding universal stress UspA family protein
MFQRILIACDSRPESEAALREGVGLARALKAEVVIFGICIIDAAILIAEANAPSDLPARIAEEFRGDLEAEATGLREAGMVVQVHCTESERAETICAAAEETKADLVVIGHRHKSALQNLYDPSKEHSILNRMPCSVLVVGNRE